jgi:hypothetical protein
MISRRQFAKGSPLLALLAGLLGHVPLPAQTTLYWDTNSVTAGAGATPTGTWNTGNSAAARRWSTNTAGTSSSTGWVANANAVFTAYQSGAPGNASNPFTVTVSGSQNISGITVLATSPAVTLSSGTLTFSDATPTIDIGSGTTLTWGTTTLVSTSGDLQVNTASGSTGTLNLANNQNLSGTLTLGGGTLALGGSNYSFGTLSVTGNSIISFAGATSLLLTELTIAAGVTLTIQNWTQATDFFYTSIWSGATQNLLDNGNTAPLNQVQFSGFGANQTGWDSYDNQIRPNVPEPATYGAMLMTALLGWFAWRRLVCRPTR